MTVALATQIRSRLDRGLRRAAWGLALTPTASLLLFYSFVLRARVALGRWPSVYNPDPKDLGSLHHLVVFYSVLAALLSVPLLFVVAVVAWYRQPRMGWQFGFAFVLCIGVLVGSMYLYRLDPGGFSEWFID